MTIRILALSLLSLLPAISQTPAEGADRLPWAIMDHEYCSYRKVYQKQPPFVYPYYTEVPLPGKEISVSRAMRAGSDWHTHQFFDSNQRPVGVPTTPTTANTVLRNKADGTGQEACVTFSYKNAGYSGIVDTVMIP